VVVAVALGVIALRSRRLQALVVVLTPAGTLAYWGWLRWSGRMSVVEAYAKYQNMVLAPPWASIGKALRSIVSGGDVLLAIKLGLVVLVVVLALAPRVRLEDRLFALAVVVQILLYTGRPLQGAARYVMVAYPTFLTLGRHAEQQWSRRQFVFYISAFGALNLIWMWSFLEWNLTF
jgi:hypothetical protein